MRLQAPYHAPHLFSRGDLGKIIDVSVPADIAGRPSELPIISSCTGKCVWAGTFGSIVDNALSDILLNPIRWDEAALRIAKAASAPNWNGAAVHPICTTFSRALSRALESVISHHDDGFLHPPPSDGRRNGSDDQTASPTAAGPSYKSTSSSKIAIVGMSGRFPGGGDDCDRFWELLRDGIDTHAVVPARSWDVKTHTDPALKRKNTAATPYGCWLDHPELFDPKFFSLSPRECPQIDPAQRMVLMTAYEALEQAGIVPDGTPSTRKDRVGIFLGCELPRS